MAFNISTKSNYQLSSDFEEYKVNFLQDTEPQREWDYFFADCAYNPKSRPLGKPVLLGELPVLNCFTDMKGSLSLREARPIVWSDFARLNYLIEGLSHETQTYIDKALFYGPYKKKIALEVLDILMQSWNILNKGQILLFYKQLEKLAHHPHILKNILINAKNYELTNIVCIQFKFNQKYKHLPRTWVTNEYCK